MCESAQEADTSGLNPRGYDKEAEGAEAPSSLSLAAVTYL